MLLLNIDIMILTKLQQVFSASSTTDVPKYEGTPEKHHSYVSGTTLT